MQMESLLSGIFPIPQQLTIPPAKLTPDNVMLNMGQSSTIIMTHRIAHFQAQANPLSAEFTRKGHEKCQDAAATIVRLMKMTSHWNVHMVSYSRLSGYELLIEFELVSFLHGILCLHSSGSIWKNLGQQSE